MNYLNPSPAPPRTHEIPALVVTRLSTARMTELLYASGRVYTGDNEPEGQGGVQPGQPYGRVVVHLARRLSGAAQEPGHRRKLLRVLVRKEVNDPGKGFDPRRALEAIEEEVFALLEGWSPVPVKAGVAFPMYRVGEVADDPFWVDERGRYLAVHEYRLLLAPVTEEEP